MLKKIGIILTVSTLISNAAFADDTGKWSVKLYGGISTMGDQSIEQTGVPGVTAGATGTINNDNGFIFDFLKVFTDTSFKLGAT